MTQFYWCTVGTQQVFEEWMSGGINELLTARIIYRQIKQGIERDESKVMPRFWECVSGGKGELANFWWWWWKWSLVVVVRWYRREWVSLEVLNYMYWYYTEMWSLAANFGLSQKWENVEKELSLKTATVWVRAVFLTHLFFEDYSKM